MSTSKGKFVTIFGFSKMLPRMRCAICLVVIVLPLPGRVYSEEKSLPLQKVIENLWDEHRTAVKQNREAVEQNRKALANWSELNQKAAEINREGLRQLNGGDFKRAIELFTEVIRIEPSFAPYMNRGIAYSENNEYEKAIDDLTVAISKNPKSAEAHWLKGQAHNDRGEFDQAKADLDKALELKPNFIEALNSRGLAHNALGDWKKALDDYDKCIELAPADPLPLKNRAMVWMDTEEYDKAVKDFSASLQIAPNDVTATFRRGASYFYVHQYERAAEDLERSIKLAPKDYRCLGFTAWFLATCPDAKYRDGQRAVKLATEGGDLDKWSDSGYYDILAGAYAESGDFAAAVNAQQQAIDMEKDKRSLTGYNERLLLYQLKQPYRMPTSKDKTNAK